MVWCVSYSNLETVDWSLYKSGGEGVLTMHLGSSFLSVLSHCILTVVFY